MSYLKLENMTTRMWIRNRLNLLLHTIWACCTHFSDDYPSGMRCLWEISIDLHWERYLRDLSETSQKRCLFSDVFKTSQIHLKKDVFCVTSLRRLEHISKKMSFPWRLWDVSKTSLASIFGFSKIRHKNDFVSFS